MKYSEGLVKIMRQCPRCASEITSKDKICPRCRLPVSKMSEAESALAEELVEQSESDKLNRAQKKEKKRLAKLAKKEAKKQKKEITFEKIKIKWYNQIRKSYDLKI